MDSDEREKQRKKVAAEVDQLMSKGRLLAASVAGSILITFIKNEETKGLGCSILDWIVEATKEDRKEEQKEGNTN